jgi:hypothetical protein
MAVVELDAPAAANYTAFWWNPAESGWGMHLTHGGNTLFALLYTYAMDGAPMWLAASNLVLQADGSYSGALARYSGPPFNQVPWGTATPTTVGTMTLRFAGSDSATLTYSVDGIPVAKTIRPYIYAANTVCVSGSPQRASAANYQDLWWNPAESGWGLALAHQGNILFGGLFTYSSAGRSVLVCRVGSHTPARWVLQRRPRLLHRAAVQRLAVDALHRVDGRPDDAAILRRRAWDAEL